VKKRAFHFAGTPGVEGKEEKLRKVCRYQLLKI
jgi:hypothetical protein